MSDIPIAPNLCTFLCHKALVVLYHSDRSVQPNSLNRPLYYLLGSHQLHHLINWSQMACKFLKQGTIMWLLRNKGPLSQTNITACKTRFNSYPTQPAQQNILSPLRLFYGNYRACTVYLIQIYKKDDTLHVTKVVGPTWRYASKLYHFNCFSHLRGEGGRGVYEKGIHVIEFIPKKTLFC